MIFRKFGFVSALCVGLSFGVAPIAANASVLDAAEAALRNGKPARAQSLVQGFSAVSRSDRQRLDWILALALVRQNQVQAAIPLLEGLVADAPDVARVRLELARAYFITGQDGAARRQFTAARAGRLSPGEAEAVDRFVARLDQRKTSESYLRFALVPETNAVRRTAAETVFLGPTGFAINARAQAGTGVRLGFGHVLTPKLGQGWQGRFGAHFDARLYRQSDITSSNLRLEAGAERHIGTMTYGGGFLVEAAGLAGRLYSTGSGAYLSYAALVGRDTATRAAGFGRFAARAEVMDLRFPDYRFSNGRRFSLSLEYRHAVSPRMALSVGLSLARTRAVAPSESSRTHGLTLGADYAFDGGLVLGGTLSHSKMRRDAGTALFPTARRDGLTVLGLRAYHSKIQFGGFAPTLDITAERRTANNVIHAYRNIGISFGLTRRF